VGGTAASIAVGILTGGLSLVVQFAIGAAAGVAKGGVEKVTEYTRYKINKRQLVKLDKSQPEKLGRGEVRSMHQNLAYNEEHFKECLFRAVRAYLKLKAWENKVAAPLSPASAGQLMEDMYTFYTEYDRALHYFVQFELFVEFSHVFAARLAEKYNLDCDEWENAAKNLIVDGDCNFHTATCRTSLVKTSICYGPKDKSVIAPSDAGLPYHTLLP